MTVLLHRPGHPPLQGWEYWAAALHCSASGLPINRQVPDLAAHLEQAFDETAEVGLAMAAKQGERADAVLAHMPSGAANVSDFGIVLAWRHLVGKWAQEHRTVLVICADPWLFRALAALPGVRVGAAPPLLATLWRLRLRGLLSRMRVSLRMAVAAWRLRHQPAMLDPGHPWIMVYGHPRSQADGQDAYFGSLAQAVPTIRRIMHVDCPPDRALALQGEGGQTLSLHGFGSVLTALFLWTQCWRGHNRSGDWLLYRARSLEAGTGSAAMIAWQLHCQRRWMMVARPVSIAWPWENHGWERALVRVARAAAIPSIGYQHATVGWREWNYSPRSNPDGRASLPDHIVCVGQADMVRLQRLGCPSDILRIGGAWRFTDTAMPAFDPTAAIFVALPFDRVIAEEMVEALRPIAAAGRSVLVKDHPMNPFSFAATTNLRPTDIPLNAQGKVAAVVYCITTVGLEALLAGLPTIRFIPSSRPVTDIAPEGMQPLAASAADLVEVLARATPLPPLDRASIFAAVDVDLWRRLLEPCS